MKTARSRKYLDFVKRQPCCYCSAPADDPHHFAGSRGTSLKASDYHTVPLCRGHHTEWHSSMRKIGQLTTDETMGMFYRTATQLLISWIEMQEREM